MTFLFHTNCFSWPQFIIKKTLFLFTFLNFISTFIFLSLPPYLSLSLPLSPSLSPSLSLSLSLSLFLSLSLHFSYSPSLSLSLFFPPISLSLSPSPSLSLSLSQSAPYTGEYYKFIQSKLEYQNQGTSSCEKMVLQHRTYTCVVCRFY